MPASTASLEHIFQTHIQTLALTLRPATVEGYRVAARRFLAYLHTAFPLVRRPSALRRNPHLLGWLTSLCERQPPLSNKTRFNYLISLRRLLDDLAAGGHAAAHLIAPTDFPPLPRYLPRALSPQDDLLLQAELRRRDDLSANALLLTRLTGIRIGECMHLSLHCLRQLGPDQWALHVPLGKLHTERMVPVDEEVRKIGARLLQLRAADASNFLLPQAGQTTALYQKLRSALAHAAQQAGCSCHVTPHQLRHNFATEMIRLGVSLPALMQLLGHKDIRMTLRYVQVTQLDLQREFHAARRNALDPHRVPVLSVPSVSSPGLHGIGQGLTALRHSLEMYRRQINNHQTRRQLHRLDRRLFAVAAEVQKIATAEK